MKIFLVEIYCLFLLVLTKYKKSIGIIGMKYFWCKFIACSFWFIIIKGIIRIKIFLVQNLLLVPFLVLITYSYHRNEIFLVQNLLLVPFGFDSKKLEKNV